MSIVLYISNKLENLGLKFSENCKHIDNVFSADVVVTQTLGIDRWLAVETAKNVGVFSNFKFKNPNAFILELARLAGLRQDSRFFAGNLKWIIYSILLNDEFISKFPLISNYYIKSDIKRFQLADKTANLFNKYLIYRQDLVESWNQGEIYVDDQQEGFSPEFEQNQEWQAWLWIQLKKQMSDYSLDLVELKNRLILKFDDPEFQNLLKSRYPRISFFGLAVVTDFYLDIYKRLSDFVDINMYIISASSDKDWYSHSNSSPSDQTNLLLSSFGSLGRDMFSILFKSHSLIDKVHHCNTIPSAPKSLLTKLQYDLFHNAVESRSTISVDDLNDGSIQIASSYTTVREVESLYNYILSCFDNDKSLEPRDIVVQMTDVDTYAPYIHAIFDNASVSIPYSISDRSYAGKDTLVGALHNLLSLSEDNFTSETVVQLLDSSFISKRFGIVDTDFIRQLVIDSNIHFGFDGNDSDNTRFVSWQYGLERMLLGYAINGGQEYSSEGYTTFPLDTFGGAQAYEMLRFKAFVDSLISMIQNRANKRDFSKWSQYVLDDIIEKFFSFKESNNDEYKYIVNHLTSLDKVDDFMNESISYDIFKLSLESALYEESRNSAFLNGKVTFCSMVPMRSIPFKVSALLGMNSSSFPRKSNKLGFDLIAIKPRKGDQVSKITDRYLFLETILAARGKLYFSYIGNSSSDNSELQPSLFIDELISYIQSGFKGSEVHDFLLSKHPLFTFSKEYYRKSNKLFTYIDDSAIKRSRVIKDVNQEVIGDEFPNVDINDIIRFSTDPFKWYYNKSLQIYYNQESSLLSETELFLLDNLQKYQVKNDLLNSEDIEGFVNRGKKTGALPLANMADVSVLHETQDISLLKEIYNKLTNDKKRTKFQSEFTLDDGTTLSGTIDDIFDGVHVHVNVSKDSGLPKYFVDAWVKHLFLVACNQPVETYFIAKYLPEPIVLKADIVSKPQAIETLTRLISVFKRGHQSIIPFIPGTVYTFYKKNKIGFHASFEDELEIEKYIKLLKSEGECSSFKTFFNHYIKKEIELGLFDHVKKRYLNNLDDLYVLADCLFSKLDLPD